MNRVNEGDLEMGGWRDGSGSPLIIEAPYDIATVGKICHGQ